MTSVSHKSEHCISVIHCRDHGGALSQEWGQNFNPEIVSFEQFVDVHDSMVRRHISCLSSRVIRDAHLIGTDPLDGRRPVANKFWRAEITDIVNQVHDVALTLGASAHIADSAPFCRDTTRQRHVSVILRPRARHRQSVFPDRVNIKTGLTTYFGSFGPLASAARFSISGPAVERRRVATGQVPTSPPLPLSSSVDGQGAARSPYGASADRRRQSISPATLAVYAAVTLRSPSDRTVYGFPVRHLARGAGLVSPSPEPRAFLSHQKGKRLSPCRRLRHRRRAVRVCAQYSPLSFVSSVSARSRRLST